jgi:hypothetical protein
LPLGNAASSRSWKQETKKLQHRTAMSSSVQSRRCFRHCAGDPSDSRPYKKKLKDQKSVEKATKISIDSSVLVHVSKSQLKTAPHSPREKESQGKL